MKTANPDGQGGRTCPNSAVCPEFFMEAEEAAREAGAILRRHMGARQRVDGEPPHDVKLALDRICEDRIIGRLQRRFPDHSILSEEAGFMQGKAEFTWIIDPLDGTVNYHQGIRYFCTSIACYGGRTGGDMGFPLLGVVFDPVRQDMFSAVRGGGAALNGAPLHAGPYLPLSSAVLGVSLSARPEEIRGMASALPRLAAAVRKIRCLGSTALDLASVAAGRLSGFLQLGTNLWDYAAAALLVREAGGFVDEWRTASGKYGVLAAVPGVHEGLREIAAEFHQKPTGP